MVIKEEIHQISIILQNESVPVFINLLEKLIEQYKKPGFKKVINPDEYELLKELLQNEEQQD